MAEPIFGVSIEDWLLFLLAIFITIVIARVVYILVRRFFDPRLTKRASKNLARLAEYLIIIFGAYWSIFFILHLNLTALFASLGIVGLAVAFASQQIIQNFIAGLIITVERRVQLEDWIEIVGTTSYKPARVRDISLTKITLLDPSGRLVHVPNSVIINSQVINYTQAGFFEVPIEIRLSRSYDLDLVTNVIVKVAEMEKDILPNPHIEGDKDLEHLFRVLTMKLQVARTDMSTFSPKVLINRIDGDDLVLSIRIWMMDPRRKDEIVSNFLKNLIKECEIYQIKFAHS